MRRRLLFLVALVALFNVPAIAQIGVVLQLTPTANINAVASRANGVIVDVDEDSNQLLLSVPAVPSNLLDSEVKWMELVGAAILPSSPRGRYLQVPATTPPDWFKTQPAFGLINLRGALTLSTGRTVVVAVIDSQVDYSHPAIIGHLTSGYDFVANKKTKGLKGLTKLDESSASYLDESSASYLDESSASYLDESSASYLDESSASYLDESSASYLDGGNPAWAHATLTMGIIAAIAPEAMIMPLRVFDDHGSADTWMVSRAIRYAVKHGAQVINMSFGSPTYSAALSKAIDYALAHNVTVIVSAGNNNTSAASQYPAGYGYPRVIATAATDLNDVKAKFSNYGSPVYVDAPGVNIVSAVPGNRYGIASGTSFSAPIIAGTAALLRALLVTDVGSRVAATSINIDAKNLIYAGQLGRGRVDILKAVTPTLP